jgi:hypothetical protein
MLLIIITATVIQISTFCGVYFIGISFGCDSENFRFAANILSTGALSGFLYFCLFRQMWINEELKYGFNN